MKPADRLEDRVFRLVARGVAKLRPGLAGGLAHRALLASELHLPPSAVPLVSDFRFRRSAQRLALLTL
jgi:hypothetical protein